VRNMTPDDLPVVLMIDRLSFPLPWPERSYRFELTKNPASHLMVAELDDANPQTVIGFIGCWKVADEVHISTLAVHPDHRRQGVGERLLQEMLDWAVNNRVKMATLEVRVSNQAAINLYRKHGFNIEDRKAGYYHDNNEDALLMVLRGLSKQ
jgi:ribosomal-protein-alanine N-acetyltransferase